jgi:predicted RNase H-like HicB family nuclease
MQIPVLIERVEGNGYRARGGEPFAVTVEGATREEALLRLQEVIRSRLADAECVPVEVPTTDNPWLRLEGVYKDDPLFDEWQAAIVEYRRQVDLDPDAR